MTAPKTAATASGISCNHLAEQIKLTKADIKAEEAHITTKTSRLHALQHAAHPDAKAIERLQACIRRIEEELAKDREDLLGDEEDFRVKCSGHTHA